MFSRAVGIGYFRTAVILEYLEVYGEADTGAW